MSKATNAFGKGHVFTINDVPRTHPYFLPYRGMEEVIPTFCKVSEKVTEKVTEKMLDDLEQFARGENPPGYTRIK